MKCATSYSLLRPSIPLPARLADLLCVGVASICIAVSARLQVHVPFSPVPLTFQTFAVLLTAVLLGPARAFGAVTLYLLEGIAGLPVFARGGGAWYLVGPTGGYLLGFLPGALATGMLAERGWDRSWVGAFGAMMVGSVVILACGTAWLAVLVGASSAFTAGFVPFVIGDAAKNAAAATVLPRVRGVVERSAFRV
jgi:biotin transport system substrate-specific component